MTRTIDQVDADAWRAIRVGNRPLVTTTTDAPRDVIRQAHMRLREMRREAQQRAGITTTCERIDPRETK